MFYPNRRDVLITLGALAAGAAIGEQVPYLRGMTASTTTQPKTTQPNTGEIVCQRLRPKTAPRFSTRIGAPKDAQPIVFHHGWPLSSDDWDAQMLFFLANGYRVVAHDGRGHSRSSQADTGNDMDHDASDASAAVEHLDLRNAVHIGHSTGGGEVARYVAKYGEPQGRVAKAALIAAVFPLMLKTEKNLGGTPIEVFDGYRKALAENRAQFYLHVASGPFYGFNRPGAKDRKEISRIVGVRV